MGYRRGFKSEANTLAQEIRAELFRGPFERLDPRCLATHLEIPIIGLTDLVVEAHAINHLITVEPEVFSAVTVFCGSHRTIVHNDGHSEPRQNSNLAHELAHALLQHPPSAALDDRGCRHWNQDIEDEANWLGAALLVSEEMTFSIAKGRQTRSNAAWQLGVSNQMIRFRMNATAAERRVQRAKTARQVR